MNRALASLLRGLALSAILAVVLEAPVRTAPQPGPTGSVSRNVDSVEILPLIDGDDLRFSRLSTAQGLSQSRVDRIVQDDPAFIFFAPQSGPNRYTAYPSNIFPPHAPPHTTLT